MTDDEEYANQLAKDYVAYWLIEHKDGVSAVGFETWLGMRKAMLEQAVS